MNRYKKNLKRHKFDKNLKENKNMRNCISKYSGETVKGVVRVDLKKKGTCTVLAALLGVSSIVGSAPLDSQAAAVQNLNKAKVSAKLGLKEGEKKTISVKRVPAKTVKVFAAADKKIVKVNKKGVVTGIKAGATEVKVTLRYKKKKVVKICKVTVGAASGGQSQNGEQATMAPSTTAPAGKTTQPASSAAPTIAPSTSAGTAGTAGSQQTTAPQQTQAPQITAVPGQNTAADSPIFTENPGTVTEQPGQQTAQPVLASATKAFQYQAGMADPVVKETVVTEEGVAYYLITLPMSEFIAYVDDSNKDTFYYQKQLCTEDGVPIGETQNMSGAMSGLFTLHIDLGNAICDVSITSTSQRTGELKVTAKDASVQAIAFME